MGRQKHATSRGSGRHFVRKQILLRADSPKSVVAISACLFANTRKASPTSRCKGSKIGGKRGGGVEGTNKEESRDDSDSEKGWGGRLGVERRSSLGVE